MNPVEMIVFDVEHGNSIYVKMLKKHVMLDCGADENNGFSPTNWLRNNRNVTKLDYLLISHPHIDHIYDISNVDNNLQPHIFSRNRFITAQKIKGENEELFKIYENLFKKYMQLDLEYNRIPDPHESPDLGEWAAGGKIVTFSNTDQDMKINDLSLVTFIQYGKNVILYGADLEKKGWENLLSKKYFIDWLKMTNILIASHHGRESGYSAEVFKYCKPQLTIVSDGRFGDASAVSRYSSVTSGMVVKKRSGYLENKKVITTRKDGHIWVLSDGTDLYVETD